MKQRSSQIDILKGLLTIGMVLEHAIQLLGNLEGNASRLFSFFLTLGAFSGFLFCFGFAAWHAYLQGPRPPWLSITKTSLKCYLAFIISGVAFRILVNSEPPGVNIIARIALVRDIPGYSEFLLSFAIIIVLGPIFKRGVEIATNSYKSLLFVSIVCLAFTLLPSGYRSDPLIGQFIGGKGFAFFPIVQYFPLFLFGVYMAKHQPRTNTWVLAVSSILVTMLTLITVAKIPVARFPPSAIWIICSAALVYVYFWLAHVFLAKLPKLVVGYLNAVGQNVLLYLVLSNIVFFVSRALGFGKSLNAPSTMIFYVMLMAFIFFIQFISVDLKRANQSINRMT